MHPGRRLLKHCDPTRQPRYRAKMSEAAVSGQPGEADGSCGAARASCASSASKPSLATGHLRRHCLAARSGSPLCKRTRCPSCTFPLLLFQGGPVEILPFLYLGSAYHASKCEFLANLHITALLNVSRKSSEPFKDQYCYKWIPVEDSHTADISSHFQEAIDFIAGGKILVHCEAGISRSPTICMAYLMKTKKLRLEEAFDYIKQRRSLISPNFGFMGQLLQYDAFLGFYPQSVHPLLYFQIPLEQ
uniref:protein-tyrosine-phosphatase n=1 Tax=Apteryx owenii TaxID=8824 RepID=A0A8B9QTH3_APTOW